MTLQSKIKKAISHPHKAKLYLLKSVSAYLLLIVNYRFIQAASEMVENFIGYNPYISRVRERSESVKTVPVLNKDFDILLDVHDNGVGRDLLIYQTREHSLVDIYIDELIKMEDNIGSLTIIEAGSNIGYYLLAAGTSVDCEIVAFEPEPNNYKLALKNMELNGLFDSVETEQAAISSNSGTVDLNVFEESNLHRISERGDNRETISVDCWSLDDYCDEYGIPYDSVDVVRMDIEGAEVNALNGMDSIFQANGDMLLFIEIHPQFVPKMELIDIYDKLNENGFQIVTVINENITSSPWPGPMDVDSFDDLHEINIPFGLIAKRTTGSGT